MTGPHEALDRALTKFEELVRTDPRAAWEQLKSMGLIDDKGRYVYGKDDDVEEAMVPEVEATPRPSSHRSA